MKCLCCGKEFERIGRQKFCSPDCRRLYYLKPVHYEKRTCPVCGTKFTPLYYNQKCCSAKCSTKNRRALAPKICEHCGKQFVPVHLNQRFCSRDCSNKHNHPFLSPTPKVCDTCGKQFIPKNSTQRFCSTDCQRHFGKTSEQNNDKKRITKTCAHCGKSFQTNYTTQKFCSAECRSQFHNANYSKPPPKPPKSKKINRTEGLIRLANEAFARGITYGELSFWLERSG